MKDWESILKTSGSSVPMAYYDPDGDCIEFIEKSVPFYARRIDDIFTVYFCQNTHKVIGFTIDKKILFKKLTN